jgi:hypothetical protein
MPIWPLARAGKGYAQIHWNGKLTNVHRLVCWFHRGNPPTPLTTKPRTLAGTVI